MDSFLSINGLVCTKIYWTSGFFFSKQDQFYLVSWRSTGIDGCFLGLILHQQEILMPSRIVATTFCKSVFFLLVGVVIL